MNDDQPLACNMAALSAAERTRHAALARERPESVIVSEESRDGIAYTIPARASLVQLLLEFIKLERRCCPSFALR